MAPTRELGPWTLHGDLAYPTVTTDRFLREGDVIWVDAGINWEGYASDYGRTWITGVDPVPSARQQEHFRRWRAVVDAALEILKPGVSALRTRKGRHRRPTTASGRGSSTSTGPTGSAPRVPRCRFVGTDLGEAFDERLIIEPGMVLVFEPVIWEEGAAGYRSEDIVAVTDTGWVKLSGSTYDPYGVRA